MGAGGVQMHNAFLGAQSSPRGSNSTSNGASEASGGTRKRKRDADDRNSSPTTQNGNMLPPAASLIDNLGSGSAVADSAALDEVSLAHLRPSQPAAAAAAAAAAATPVYHHQQHSHHQHLQVCVRSSTVDALVVNLGLVGWVIQSQAAQSLLVCACVRLCALVCACVRLCALVCACVCLCVLVCACGCLWVLVGACPLVWVPLFFVAECLPHPSARVHVCACRTCKRPPRTCNDATRSNCLLLVRTGVGGGGWGCDPPAATALL